MQPQAQKLASALPANSNSRSDYSDDVKSLPDTPQSPHDIVPAGTAPVSTRQDDQTKKKLQLVAEARTMIQQMVDAMDNDSSTFVDSTPAFSRNCLKAFAISPDFTVEKFVNSGGLRSVATALKKYARNGTVADSGCKSLATLTLLDSTLVRDIANSGAIEAIITVLNSQIDCKHESATVSALLMLRNLTESEEFRQAICKNEGTEAVIKSMDSQIEDARSCSHAALVLSNLAFGNLEAKEHVGQLGGIAAIAKAMTLHSDVQAMQARGSLALRNLCYNSEKNQAIAGENGAIEVLLRAIDGFLEDREIAHQSCVALANMSSINPDNRGRIVKAQGVRVTLKLLNKYPESGTAMEDGISILRNIAAGNEVAQADIGRSGGIEIIVRAMQRFKADYGIVGKSTAALRYLCFLDENRSRVAACGGIEAIVNALKSSKSSAVAVENSLLAIGNSTFESPDSKATVGRCGGIQAILQALSEHLNVESIQEHGCRVLRNLGDGFEFNRRLEIDHGAINAAVLAMMGYPDSAAVQEQGLAMLLNLSMNESSLEKLRAAEVPRLTEKAINTHASHRGVILQGGRLLDKIGGTDESPSPRAATRTESGSKFGIRHFSKAGRRPG